MFRYNSGGKEFYSLETKHLSIQVDGLMIKKDMWDKKPGAAAKTNQKTLGALGQGGTGGARQAPT